MVPFDYSKEQTDQQDAQDADSGDDNHPVRAVSARAGVVRENAVPA